MIDKEKFFSNNWKEFNDVNNYTPNLLMNLYSKNKTIRYKAMGELESLFLGYFYDDVSPLLLPSIPYLFEASKEFEADEIEYFLDMIWNALYVLNPYDNYYPIRRFDLTWTKIPGYESTNLSVWQNEIFEKISEQLERFLIYLSSSNDSIFRLAVLIISRLNLPHTKKAGIFLKYILDEKNPPRKACLYNELRLLHFDEKVEILAKRFDNEEEPDARSVIASIIAHESKLESPLSKPFSDELEKYIFSNISLFIAGTKKYWWIWNFFHDLVIPYSLFSTTQYETLLEYYIEFMAGIVVEMQENSEIFLAFALGFNGKPNYKKLSRLQLQAIKCLFCNKHVKAVPSSAYPTFNLPTTGSEIYSFFKENKFSLEKDCQQKKWWNIFM